MCGLRELLLEDCSAGPSWLEPNKYYYHSQFAARIPLTLVIQIPVQSTLGHWTPTLRAVNFTYLVSFNPHL